MKMPETAKARLWLVAALVVVGSLSLGGGFRVLAHSWGPLFAVLGVLAFLTFAAGLGHGIWWAMNGRD